MTSEWWTYRLGDLLMFAPETYYRLIERYNTALWPLHIATLLFGLAVFGLRRRRVAPVLLGIVWIWVGWSFHFERYATIFPFARWLGAMFVVEGVLLVLRGAPGPERNSVILSRPSTSLRTGSDGEGSPARARWSHGCRGFFAVFAAQNDTSFVAATRIVASALFFLALFAFPFLAPWTGRPWSQAEVFGIAPDPTVLATLAFAVVVRSPLLLVIPILSCVLSGATLWAMESPVALVMPVAGLIALVFAAVDAIASRRTKGIR